MNLINENDYTDEVRGGRNDYYSFDEANLAVLRLMRLRARRGATVLDLGCGRGRLGAELRQLGYHVTGVESETAPFAAAQSVLDEALEFDLTDYAAADAALGARRFDWIIAADVLEHLAEPLAALRHYRRFIADRGRIVISVPNVAVWYNRLRILAGRFDYEESGVMDRRHLRFFTRRSARQLVIQAGFTPMQVDLDPGIARAFTPIARKMGRRRAEAAGPDAILSMPLYRIYASYLWPAERIICRLAPGLLGFRIVIEAGLSDS